jgi:hypothetical protein
VTGKRKKPKKPEDPLDPAVEEQRDDAKLEDELEQFEKAFGSEKDKD